MKTLKNFYFFEDSIDRVFMYLRDFKKTDSLFEDIRSATEITKGSNTFEVGNSFHYFVNSMKIEFQVLETIEEEKMRQIKWNVQVAESKLNYDYEYILHKCTVGGDLILEWNLCIKENADIDAEIVIKDLNECMSRIKKKLKNDLTDYYLSEALVINCEREKIKNYIVKLDQLKSSSTLFGKVKYSSDSQKIGTKVTFEIPFVGMEIKFIVEEADFNENLHEWKYSLKSKINQSGSLSYLNEIIFTIIKVSSTKTFIEVKHTFNSQVSRDKINGIREDQNLFLKELKALTSDTNKDKDKDE